jgi:UDP-N-acetylmuramyl pentapeptide synthase
MKAMIIRYLRARAKAIREKFNPRVIAVTGSMGKTSTKEAIAIVLARAGSVRTSQKNFNNEIGVPLTILGQQSPGKSLFGWMKLFRKSYSIKNYPEYLLLEFGADHPGDIKALCELAPPDVSIVTGISPVHAEYFKDIDALIEEKMEIVRQLRPKGVAILNGDEKRILDRKDQSQAKVVSYGLNGDISARNIRLSTRYDDHYERDDIFSMTYADVYEKGSMMGTLELKNILGYASVISCLAAIAVGREEGIMPMESIRELNKHIKPLPGRLRPIAGIKGSLILDDTYNAAPAAMQLGLDTLSQFTPVEENDRRIAVLGAMAELGSYTEQEHRLIGLKAAEVADIFIGVGANMHIAVEAAKEAGIDTGSVKWFATSKEAGREMDRIVQEGDIVYVKGSQSTRMEHVVKDIMADPASANTLLVRQDRKWLGE